MIKLDGTMVKEPEYREGVSASGFEWESVDLYIEEGGVEKPSVFKCGGFGKIAKQVRDMNLMPGSVLSLILRVDSRQGSGVHEGKWFMSLGIESMDFVGMNNSADGVVEEQVFSENSGNVNSQAEVMFDNTDVIDGDLPF